MDCREWIEEIVEGARAGAPPRFELSEHLDGCPACRDRWEAEVSLEESMRSLRLAVRGRRSPHYRRDLLIDEFARIHRQRRGMGWVLRVAAAVLVALAAGLLSRTRLPADPRMADADMYQAAPVTVPPEMAGESGFVEIPYTPPLAAGEQLTVVRTELEAAALNRMGFEVIGMNGDVYPADVVLGEDGLPRAVRVLGDDVSEN
jgi:hypothetical protein